MSAVSHLCHILLCKLGHRYLHVRLLVESSHLYLNQDGAKQKSDFIARV